MLGDDDEGGKARPFFWIPDPSFLLPYIVYIYSPPEVRKMERMQECSYKLSYVGRQAELSSAGGSPEEIES